MFESRWSAWSRDTKLLGGAVWKIVPRFRCRRCHRAASAVPAARVQVLDDGSGSIPLRSSRNFFEREGAAECSPRPRPGRDRLRSGPRVLETCRGSPAAAMVTTAWMRGWRLRLKHRAPPKSGRSAAGGPSKREARKWRPPQISHWREGSCRQSPPLSPRPVNRSAALRSAPA